MMRKLLILTLTILLILSGCDKKDTALSDETTQDMTVIEEAGMKNVFRATENNMQFKYVFLNVYDKYFDRIFYMDGKVYLAAGTSKRNLMDDFANHSQREDDYENFIHTGCVLLSFDSDGVNEETIEITQVNPSLFADIRFMRYDSEYNQITIEDFQREYTLYKRTGNDELIFSMSLKDIFGEDITIRSMGTDENDNIYITSYNILLIVSKDGEILTNIKYKDGFGLHGVTSAQGKKPIFKTASKDGILFQYFDIATGEFTPIELVTPMGNHNYEENHIMYGEGYDYYYYNNIGVYGYDIASNTLTKVLDWLNSDITLSETSAFLPLSPERMVKLHVKGAGYDKVYSLLERASDDEIPDKTYLSIGYIDPNNNKYLTRAVSDFNKNNDFYRITLTNYFTGDREALDPALRLNNAIAAGEAPDMLFVNSYMPILSYSNKDMLVDLNEFLAEYEGLQENLLPFVKNAEIKDKLTYMITGFTGYTLMGKTSNIGDKGKWTFGEMLEMYKSSPSDVQLMHDLSRHTLAAYALDKLIADCVDYSAMTCDFSKQGVKDFLELMKILPDYYDYSQEYGGDYIQIQNERFEAHRKDEILLSSMFIITVRDYLDTKINNYRDADTTVIGYPTINGDIRGDYLDTVGFALLNSAENKDVAWDFIMYCLSDHISSYSIDNGYLTPTRSGIDRCNQDYGLMDYNAYDDFVSIGKDHDAFVDGVDGIYIKCSDWFGEFNGYVKNIENFVYRDNDIRAIIFDELSSFFTTDKTADEIIKVIQSRVSVYLSEMWG